MTHLQQRPVIPVDRSTEQHSSSLYSRQRVAILVGDGSCCWHRGRWWPARPRRDRPLAVGGTIRRVPSTPDALRSSCRSVRTAAAANSPAVQRPHPQVLVDDLPGLGAEEHRARRESVPMTNASRGRGRGSSGSGHAARKPGCRCPAAARVISRSHQPTAEAPHAAQPGGHPRWFDYLAVCNSIWT